MAEEISAGKLFVELLVKDEKYGPQLRSAMAELDNFRAKVVRSGQESANAVKPIATAFSMVTDAEKRQVAAVIASTATEKARAAALGITVAELRRVDAALKSQTASTSAATAAAKGHTAAIQSVGVSTEQARGAAQNLRFQLFDVVQQLAAGQNPLMIANQQGFQIAQAFSAGGSAASTFTAALGPLGPAFTAIAASIGPVSIALAALVDAYSFVSLAMQENYEAGQGVIDSQLRAAKAVKATEDQIKAAAKAWRDYNSDLMDVEVREAVLSGALTEDEAKALTAQQQALARYAPEIERLGKEWASASTELAAYQAQYGRGRDVDKMAEADKKIQELTPRVAELAADLEARKTEAYELAGRLGQLVIKEGKAKEEGKDATKAMKDAARAAEDYASALAKIGDVTDDSAQRRSATVAEMTPSNPVEQKAAKATEAARKRAQDELDKVDAALADALAAATTMGGEMGAAMAAEAQSASADARRAIAKEYSASLDAAAKEAVDTERDAARKRVDQERATVDAKVGTQEEYLASISEIEKKIADIQRERVMVDVDYARLSADERLAIEEKLQADIAGLREDAAEAERRRSAQVAKDAVGAIEGIVGRLQSLLNDVAGQQKDTIRDIDQQLEADANARKKREEGVALSAAEQESLLTYAKKKELRERREAEQKAAMEVFEAQQALALISIAISTATAVMQAFAQLGPIAGAIAGVVITGIGIAQAAIVANQKPPEFHVGGMVTAEDRRASPGRSTGRAVTTELEVGEGIVVGRTVQALGGAQFIERLNVDPFGAISEAARRLPSPPAIPSLSRLGGSGPPQVSPAIVAAGQVGQNQPLVIVSKIGERTFDSVLATGINSGRTPQVKRSMRRMIGTTVGLER